MSDPILQLLAEPPAPPMVVDEYSIRRGGRRRLQRRRFVRIAGSYAAAVVIGVVVWTGAAHRVIERAQVFAAERSAVSPLDAKVYDVALSPGAVAMTLPDGAKVWVDPGKLSTKSQMRMAARNPSQAALGVGSKATEPVGKPYFVPMDWSRTLVSDRLLVWGVDLEGTAEFKPDLHGGARVVSTTSALIPGTHSIVYVLDVRSPSGGAPASVDAVTGMSMRTPRSWPPAR